MSTIFATGIEFFGFHGVSDAERLVGHRFSANVEVEAEQSASLSDDVADTIDYGDLCRIVMEVGTGPSVKTVERLAGMVADRVLAEHPSVATVVVELSKLSPPLPFTVAATGVRLRVERSSPK